MFQRLLEAAGLSLVVVDGTGRLVQPMRESDDLRDGGGRRYPSHLDAILDPEPGEWWADGWGMARPPETFYRDRDRRDAMRWRAIWQIRVSKYRGHPEPPDPDAQALRHAARERRRQDWLEGLRPEVVDYPEDYWDDL